MSQTMKENQTNHYFTEWWERAMELFFLKKTKRLLGTYFPSSEKIVIDGSCACEPMPEFLKEWLERNPRPGIDRDKFIVALAKRVEALEAAIKEHLKAIEAEKQSKKEPKRYLVVEIDCEDIQQIDDFIMKLTAKRLM